MMKKLLPSLILIFLSGLIFGQTPSWGWAKNVGYTNNEHAENIAKDSENNVYVTGSFSGDSIRFGNFKLTKLFPSYSASIFIVKYDTAGNVIWARAVKGEANSYGITVDKDNNVIIGGSFYSTMDFGLSIFLNNGGSSDIFIAKFTSNGSIIWARAAGGSQTDYCSGVGVDSSGNIYQTGLIGYSTSSYFGSIELINDNSIPDIYMAKYDSSGTPVWANNIGGPCTAAPRSIVTDKNGNTYICGYFFNSSIDFYPYTLSNSGGTDAFIAKYNADGYITWANKIGSTSDEYAIDLALDKLNNIYVSGYFKSSFLNINGTVLINHGNNDIFLSKLDVNGNFSWSKQVAGIGSDFTSSICTDEGSNVYMVSDYNSSSIFIDTTEFINNGTTNILITKYNTNGATLFALSVGGNNSDYATNSVVNSNSLYLVGDIQSTNSVYGSTILNSNGISDILIAKLDLGLNCSSLSSLVIDSCGLESYISPSGNQTYTVSGNYFDTIPNLNGCDSLITINLVIDSNIISSFYSYLNPIDSLNLMVVNTSFGNIISYLWDFGDGVTSTLAYPQHSYSSIGTYQICLTVFDSLCSKKYCDSTSINKSSGINSVNVLAPIPTEIIDNEFVNLDVKIYPNPTTETIHLIFKQNDEYKIEILDELGRLQANFTFIGNTFQSKLPPAKGFYFIRISSNKITSMAKIFKI